MSAIKLTSTPTNTVSTATGKTASKALVTAVQKRGPEPWFPSHWDIVTKNNGAVVARATGIYHVPGADPMPTTRDITMAPASSVTKGVKTYTFAIPKASGTPVFKITPYTYETMDFPEMAFGQDTFALESGAIPDLSGLQTVVAIRNSIDYTDVKEPGAYDLVNHTIRAYEQVLGFGFGMSVEEYKAKKNASTTSLSSLAPSPSLASITATMTSPISAATTGTRSALDQNSAGVLSQGAIAGIAAGAGAGVLALGVLVLGLVRSYQKGKRTAEVEAFKMTKLTGIESSEAGFKPSDA
jgi:hypothetical protein